MASIWDDLESQGPSPEKTPVAKATTGGSIWDSLEAPATDLTKPQSRTIFGAANDYVIEFANAAASLPKAALDLASPGSKASEAIGEFIKEGESKQSDVVKAAKAKLSKSMQSDSTLEEIKGAGKFVLENPLLSASMAAGSFVGPGFAVKGGKALGGALGLGTKGTTVAGTAAGSAVGGVLAGGDAAGSAYDLVMNSPSLKDLPLAEREEMATEAARKAAVVPGIVGLVAGATGAEAALAKGISRGVTRTALKEFGTEAIEEGVTQLSSNVAAGQFAPEIKPFQGVAGAATLGGLLGGGTGAAVGFATRSSSGSMLSDANDVGTEPNTESGAINKAIDSQTAVPTLDVTEVPKTPVEQAVQAAGSQQAQAVDAAAAKQAQEAEALAAEQQRLQQVNETRQSVFQKYGGVVQPLGQKSAFNFQGKIYYTQNQLNQALDKLVEAEAQKSEVQLIVEGAYAAANRLVGGKILTPAALQKAVAPYVDQAESKEEILARVELDLQQALQNVKSPQQLAKVEPLHALRDELAGIPVEQRVPTVDLLPKAEPKGKQNERLQLQSDAGLRTVSEQGGTTQTVSGQPRGVQPSSVQPVQPGSVTQGQTGQQVGAVPGEGIRTSAVDSTADGRTVSDGQGQAQGQVNVSQVAAQTGRGSVSDQTATRDGTSEEAIEETAEGIVKQVVNSIIDAVVVRKGRMKKADLAKFKDFIYYDFFQIENKKEGKDGLNKKELAQMFEVTPDTIDGWQKNAAAFFEENRGVIQQKILEALAQNNLTLDNLMDAVKARRDKVESEAVILEEGQSLSEVTREDEEAVKGEVKEVAATDQELGTEEGVLDERDLAGDNVGMSVNQGRVQGSIQEQGKPEETINARIKRKLEQYSEAVAEGNEELEAQLMTEIDELTQEAKKVDSKRVAKATAIAEEKAPAKKEPKKRKKVKDAIQEPSAEKVSVRKRTGSSEGVRKEDTEKREAAPESKAEEKALTPAEAAEQSWNELAAKHGIPTYDTLSDAVKADWVDSVQSGNAKLKDAQVVFDKNQETKTVSEAKLDEQIAELPKAQVQALEKHYGVDKDSSEFFDRVKEDVVNYINKGAQAVSGAIRSIIKTISEGMLATALIFNPGTYQGINYDLPAFMKETRAVVAEAPKNVEMSTVAQRTYEVSAPTFAKAKTPFFIADKPNGKIHLFDDAGKHIASSDALYGKTEGDVLTAESRAKKADELADVDKVTPAGTYTITVSQNPDYEGGYVLRLNDKNGDLGGVAIHSVYLGDAKENRPAKLLSKDLKDKKISYGCINTSQDFFVNKILPKIGSFENAGVVVIPDAQDTLMAFVKPTTESKRREMARGGVATEQVGKEETVAVTVDNKAKTPTTRIFANRAIKLFSDLRRLLTREQFDVLNKLDYQTVKLDSETKESVEMAFVTLQDLAKFPSIVKALQALKLSPQALLSIDKFAIFKNEGAFEGADGIQTTYVNEQGNLQVVLGMNESGFLSRTDAEITHTFLHETGHGVDLPGYEAGVYSSQPEFRKGGMVREELTKLFKTDSDFAFLAYPLDNKQDEEVTRGELFAQVWAAYLNPEFRVIMEKKAPQTAKYMEDVVNDVKTTTFSRGTPEAAGSQVKQKAKLFADYRGQRLAGTKGDVKINLTPAEKRYVNSDQFQEDVTQFAQDEGFEKELLLSDDYFDVDNKANQLTIPASMVTAMRKFFDWLVYSEAGYLGTIPPRFRSGRTFFNKGSNNPSIKKLPKPLQGPAAEIANTINDFARFGITRLAFTEQLANRASKYIKSAKEYVALVREQQAVKTKYERRVDLILQQYDKLAANLRGTGPGSVNAFLKASTMAGKWAFDPGYLKKAPEIDAGLQAQFDAMPKSAQDVVKAVFKHGFDTLQDMKKGVIDNITSEYDALIKAARDTNDVAELNLLEKKKAKALKDYNTLMAIQAGKPYAPLKRFGNFVVVAKSDDYLEQEAIIKDKAATEEQKKEARSKLRELEKSEEHYFVSFAETKREGRTIEKELRSEGYGYVSEAFEKDSTKVDVYGGRDVQNVFYRLRNLANDSLDENTGDKSTKAINRLINDLHLTLLAEQSARQSERRRKGVAGAEDDMMRSFATQGMATAHFIATLHNSGKIYDSLQKMQREADVQTPGRDIRREYYNEFMKRHALGLEYEPNTILNKALGTTSFYMLLTNPAYYLQNMTQPFMLSLPSVAGKHGYNKSWAEFSRAYKEIFQMINKDGLSEESYSKLPADVREAIETLVNSGRIDISLDQDLGRWRDSEGSKTELAGKAIEKLRKVAQDIESVNRVATAVAAYRLEKASGSSKDDAIAYANEIILDTHGDYSGFNAPRITRKGLGRLATQFRKFQLIQISLMAKLIKQSFAGASREEKMIARRALGFTLGHTLAVGGVMGFPGFAAIAWVMGAAFGDDDEPDNPELTLRKMIGNKEIADVILKGAPKFFGVDLSGKLGMGQMLSILPYTDVDLSKAGIAQAGYALMTGPTGSLVQRAGEGLSLMADGEYYKGTEKFMPAAIAQSMKAARFGLMEGITLKNGDVVMKPDEISFLDMLSVAIGLPSNKITDRQFVQGVAIETDKFYKDRTGEIKRDYVKAVKEKDTAGMAKARQEWVELQNVKARQKLQRQPLSDLMKAPQEQKKRERNVESGVPVSKSNKQYIKEISKI